MLSGRVPGWVWMVLVGGHIIGMSWALYTSSWSFPDSGRYLQAAENLRLYGELYARPWPVLRPFGQAIQEFTIRPPVYPLVVWALGGTMLRPAVVLAVQNILSLVNIGLVLNWWTRRALPTSGQWKVVVLGVLSFPAQIIYANAVMSEILLQTVVLGMAGAGLLFIKTKKRRYFFGVAVALIIALLLKPVFYPITLGLAGIGIGLAGWHRRVSLGLIGLLPVLVVGLYMGWNEQRTGYFHFSSIAEINLLHYNAAGVVRQLEGPVAEEKWVADVLREANAAPDFAARQRLIQTRAGAVLWAHPVVYARQHVQGMVTFFLDPGRFDVSQFLRLAPLPGGGLLAQVRAGGLVRAVAQLPLGLLGLLGVVLLANLARLVLAARGFRQLGYAEPMLRYGRWIAAGLLLYVALLTGPLGAARFLVPVWPLLLALTLAGLPQGQLAAQKTAPVREDQCESRAEDGGGQVSHPA